MRRLLKAKVGPVNLLDYAYAGSNQALPTILIIKVLRFPQGNLEDAVKNSAVHWLCTFSVQKVTRGRPTIPWVMNGRYSGQIL